jgi:translation initiation factor 1 (eIF-1/SUI1)
VEKEATKAEEEQPAVQSSKTKSTLKEKYIVIEVKNRGKKNFITTVSGLNNFSIFATM